MKEGMKEKSTNKKQDRNEGIRLQKERRKIDRKKETKEERQKERNK